MCKEGKKKKKKRLDLKRKANEATSFVTTGGWMGGRGEKAQRLPCGLPTLWRKRLSPTQTSAERLERGVPQSAPPSRQPLQTTTTKASSARGLSKVWYRGPRGRLGDLGCWGKGGGVSCRRGVGGEPRCAGGPAGGAGLAGRAGGSRRRRRRGAAGHAAAASLREVGGFEARGSMARPEGVGEG